MSVEEYLHLSFPDLDREYRDGEIVERSLPTYLHGKTQGILIAIFIALRSRMNVFPSVETRMKIRTGVYLVPDVAVFYPDEPSDVPENPPLIAIEVLSPDDRLTARGKSSKNIAPGVCPTCGWWILIRSACIRAMRS